jgi:hypothetical protein
MENIKQYLECLNGIIDENKKDIGDDTTSDYSKMRLDQNKILKSLIKFLKELNDAHKYQE